MMKADAVIEIGSTGIRLLVAEIRENGKWNTVDSSAMPVSIGRDVFMTGSLQNSTMSQCLKILGRYKEQLAGWGIPPEEVSVIATSALREARDSDSIVDRILVKTGFKVKIIDGIEENRLMYIAVRNCLQEKISMEKTDSIILEVGGGTTEMMLIKQGNMAGAHSLRLGTTRIEQHMPAASSSFDNARRYIKQFIQNTKASLNNELNLSGVEKFIAVGNDPLVAAINYGRSVSKSIWEISREDFELFVNDIQNYTVEECVARFKISYNDALQMQKGLLIYSMFIQLTNVDTIIVPETNIRHGLLLSRQLEPDAKLQQEFYSQIIASAKNLNRRYHADEEHAKYVSMASLKIFDELKDEMALDDRARMLLEVSAILHDIGMFIRMENHQLHSSYIIKNSEIFGLNRGEITIVSQIAKYHRGNATPDNDDQFQMLSRQFRMTILKLTAVLRIADALDRAHTQKFPDISITKQNDALILHTASSHNTVLEKQALSEKSGMFEAIFGYKIVLS